VRAEALHRRLSRVLSLSLSLSKGEGATHLQQRAQVARQLHEPLRQRAHLGVALQQHLAVAVAAQQVEQHGGGVGVCGARHVRVVRPARRPPGEPEYLLARLNSCQLKPTCERGRGNSVKVLKPLSPDQ
jgi:hypothetical protein